MGGVNILKQIQYDIVFYTLFSRVCRWPPWMAVSFSYSTIPNKNKNTYHDCILCIPKHIYVVVSLHLPSKSTIHLGKYTSPMDGMGWVVVSTNLAKFDVKLSSFSSRFERFGTQPPPCCDPLKMSFRRANRENQGFS